LSGTEDLVHVERVEKNKSKKTKLGIYTPSDPIKTTHEYDNSITSDNLLPLFETRTRSDSRDGCDDGGKEKPPQ